MFERTTFVGLDVHKANTFVTMLRPGCEPLEWSLLNQPREIERLARRLKKESGGDLACYYEAGPCGYALQRELTTKAIPTHVVAPSLIPRKPGERIKTDRRDARKLAEMARAQLLTVVHAPNPKDESVRDLCRCREDAVEDLGRARHRLSKMLLRLGLSYHFGRNWSQGHRRWLHSLKIDQLAARVVFEDYLAAVEMFEERIGKLDRNLEDISKSDPYRERVGWLRCFRGIDTVTAMTLLAELFDFERFESPRKLMAYLGLVPGERSSGEKVARTSITKTGNNHVRTRLVETAWHYRHRPAVGKELRKRRENQPDKIIAIADKAQRRLNQRFHRLLQASKKPPQKAIIAVARELVGFIWAVLYGYPRLRATELAA